MSTIQFQKDELVWAKIEGYPWWPGIVVNFIKNPQTGEEKGLVNFLGEYTHAVLPLDKIEHYQEKYPDYSKTKKIKLRNAIDLADKLKKGEVTYEGNFTKLFFQNV